MKQLLCYVPFFFIITTLNVFASDHAPLKKAILLASNDSVKLDLLNEYLGESLEKDSIELNPYIANAIKLAEKTNNDLQRAKTFHVLGKYYTNIYIFEKAIKYLESAKNAVLKESNAPAYQKELGAILSSYALLYHLNGDFDIALEMYFESLEYLIKTDDFDSLIKLYIRISDCYYKTREDDKGISYFQKAFALTDKANSPKSKAEMFINYGNSLTYENKYDSAELMYNKALEISFQTNSHILKHNIYYNKGFIYSQQDKYQQALESYELAYQESKAANNTFDQCDALYKIGTNYYYNSQFRKAEEILDSAFRFAQRLNSSLLLRNIYDTYTYMEYDRKNYKKAWDYLNNSIDESEKVYSEETRKQINFLEAKFEKKKREYEIEKLETEKMLQKATIQKRTQMLYGFVIALLLLIVSGVSMYRNFKDKQKLATQNALIQEQQIQTLEKEKELVALNSTLQGEEAERSRLARDLHDGLGGILSGVKLTLMNMKGNAVISEEGLQQYEHALSLMDSSIKELRQIAHNMMPEILIKNGLKDALENFCNNISSKTTDVKFYFYGESQRFEEKLEITCYRVAQELINNALKHSKASEITVQFIQEEKRINLNIQDNGCGFDPKTITGCKGNGLSNIQARVNSFEGRFDLYSSPENGTEISIEFELTC